MAKSATPVLDRMWDKFVVSDGCWEWTAALNHAGYGKILDFRRIALAHRVMWEVFNGPIPDGMELDHLCRNRRCIRPDHLEPVSHRVNQQRALVKTHCIRGHELSDENTYRYSYGRVCKLCQKARNRLSKGA